MKKIAPVLTSMLLLISLSSPAALAGGPPYEKNLNRGLKKLEKGDYQASITYFTKVLTEDPRVFDAYLNRASAREHLKDYDGALADYEQATKINPNVVACFLKRGDLYMSMGKQKQAIDDYTQAMRLDPKNIESYLKRARALKFNGNYDKAAKDYEAVLGFSPKSKEAHEGSADCKRHLNDYDGAIAEYRYLLKKYKKDAFPLHYELGEVLQLKGETKEAKEHFEQIITYYTKTLERSRKKGWDYLRRGLAYYELGEKDKALSDLENGVQLLPNDAMAHYKLAHVLLDSGDTQKALKELDEALKVNGSLHAALIDRAEANMILGNNAAAKEDLDKALATEKDARGYINRALVDLAIGDSLSARDDLKQAKSLNSRLVQAEREKMTTALEGQKTKDDKGIAMAGTLHKLALFDLAEGDLEGAESTEKQSLSILEKELTMNDPSVARGLLLLGLIYQERGYLLKAEALYRTALEKFKKSMGDEFKYALFHLEDCANVLMAASKYEEAGSILSDTRMLRSSSAIKERAYPEKMLAMVEKSLDAYKQKKKYDRQEELVRRAAGIRSGGDDGDGDSTPQVVINKPIRDKWAVIVGISRFKNSDINLQYAAKDARDFYDFLIKERNFAPDHVQILTDEEATRANILSVLGSNWLPRVAEPDDLVMIYFSSHGSPSDIDVGGVNYLVAHDTDPKNLFITGIAMQDLARIIKGRVQAQRIVLLLDACHSGVVAPSSKGLQRVCNVDPDKVVQGTGQLVITSSMPSQRSWESSRYKGSVFTKHLIDGLRKDGVNTNLGEAFNYLESQVQREVLRDRGLLQTPVMKSKWSGNELIIGVPPTNPSTGLPEIELPDHLATDNKKAQTAPASTSSGVSANQNIEDSSKGKSLTKGSSKTSGKSKKKRR